MGNRNDGPRWVVSVGGWPFSMIPSPILPARAFLAMLTNDQILFFQTFGFVCLRQFFSQAEIVSFAREAEWWKIQLVTDGKNDLSTSASGRTR